MRTPNRYLEFYKNKIVDEQMLADVIYAFNKRAKNARDKNKWNTYEKDLCYKKKEALIKVYFNDKIKCIHKQLIHNKRFRIYDDDPKYNLYKHKFIYENSYYDWYNDTVVNFGDLYIDDYLYFLYFEIGDKSFHVPITHIYKKLSNLPVKELSEDFYTEGIDERKILSKDFCEKVFNKYIISKYSKTWKTLKF